MFPQLDNHTEGASQRIQEDTKKFAWFVWVLGEASVLQVFGVNIIYTP